jgi:hypothetical protein
MTAAANAVCTQTFALAGFGRLDEIPLGGALIRDEEAAMRALEPALGLVFGAEELTAEGLATVGTDDLVGAWGRGFGHRSRR